MYTVVTDGHMQVIRAGGAWRLEGAELLRKLGVAKLQLLDLSHTATVVDDRLADALQGACQLQQLSVSRTRCMQLLCLLLTKGQQLRAS